VILIASGEVGTQECMHHSVVLTLDGTLRDLLLDLCRIRGCLDQCNELVHHLVAHGL